MALNLIKNFIFGAPPPNPDRKPRAVVYESLPVDIPDDFLRGPSNLPVTLTHVPFASSAVPEYKSCIAFTIDNVLSEEECKKLIELAERSAIPDEADSGPWRPALVALAPGVEAPSPDYRKSDRIVWDRQEIVDRIWARCRLAGHELDDLLAVVKEENDGWPFRALGQWEFSRPNERMRFLKYSVGDFFRPHCDGPFQIIEGEREFQTHYTAHLYLNDSVENSAESDLVGGSTAFLSRNGERRLDINPKTGTILVFQHKRLYHEGAAVEQGQKFTVRMDILYEWITRAEEQDAEEHSKSKP